MFAKCIKNIFVSCFVIFTVFIPHILYAQTYGGSQNTAIIISRCTCTDGYLALMIGVPGTPTGLYHFSAQTQYWVGSGQPTAWNLIDYTQNGGNCEIRVYNSCVEIPGHAVNWYGGSS